ncbi:cytochrome P450 [Fodinicola feengrottensis]|uniref:Cytochrome P450 n=1 Tax=Fodinicola feengrottensis TaxID=435914 RepID=A0ABN2H604_9ACTN|nr:cytochrome P450 [Fodinicola feengrottensis]
MTTTHDGVEAMQTFPMRRQCPYAPPPEYAGLRAAGPVARVRFPSGVTGWVVTRHEEARQVLTDRRISTDSSRPDWPQIQPGEQDRAAPRDGFFIDMDPPEHDIYRRMLISEFSVPRLNAMRPGIQRTVDELIDQLLASGRSADLVEAFTLAVPSLVICQLLGVPYEDHEYFQSRTRKLVSLDADPAEATAAVGEIWQYLDQLVTRAERQPGDNLIGRLVAERLSSGELSHDGLVGMSLLLLVAGHETTANILSLGVLTLLDKPESLASLRANPADWPGTVEELLRFHSIVDWAAFDRMAIEDLELGGQLIRAGDPIFVLGGSVNRDDRLFPNPDDFDITRPGRRHLAFGYGVHQCLGQNLARAEMDIALRTLFDRVPGLALGVPVEELSFKYDAAIFGLHRLPVVW